MPARERSAVEYPFLGEPPVIEFVNTLYIDPHGMVDFLGTIDLARGWFQALEPAIMFDVQGLDETARHGFVALRTAIRTVFDATPTTELASAIGVLESTANASPGRLELSASGQNQLVARTTHDPDDPAGAAALLAFAAITIAIEGSHGRVLICDRPFCNMRYFQQHRRRRYCNPACANSDRQSRFQQRHKN